MNTAPKLTVMSDTRFTPASATPAIEVLSAEKIYSNGTRALLPVNLTINQGEFITLLGPSGCGKSTLLKMVAGLVEPSDGKLMLWRRDSREKAQHPLSFVFQEATLMPWSSVRNNVRLPLDLAGVPRAEGNTRGWANSPTSCRANSPAACKCASPSPAAWSPGQSCC